MGLARAGIVAVMALGLAFGWQAAGWAGGEADDHDDHDEQAGGVSYYGFVKDHRGVLVGEAKVAAEIKNRGTIVTHTNILGAYRIPSFGKEISPDDISISCSKEGYRQLRITRRSDMNEAKKAIEIECTLQRL